MQMDIENRLIELTEETLSFGNVINAFENSGNSDLQNACSLFSQYLDDQLHTISASPIVHNSYTDIQVITEQLHTLSSLIAKGQLDPTSTQDWSRKLTGFCSQLQLIKNTAA